LEAIAQAVHLDLTATGMAIAMMHEQNIHDANARGSNLRKWHMVRRLVMRPHDAMAYRRVRMDHT
jgi:hypothetical protein